MNRYTKSFLFTVLTPLACVVLLLGSLYVYDPLQLFHKPWLRANTVQDNLRLQAAGLLNNYDFDGIIIGNSHSENTSPKVAGELFGGTFFNLSMSGSGHYERSYIIEAFLRKKKARMVIDQADYFISPEGGKLYWLDSYTYLYDDKGYNDFLAYLNSRTLGCLATFSTAEGCVGASTEVDRPAAWFRMPYHAARFGGLDTWLDHYGDEQLQPFFDAIQSYVPPVGKERRAPDAKVMDQFRDHIDTFIIAPAKAHPEVRFVYLDVPWSTLYTSLYYHGETLEAKPYWLKLLVEKTAEIPNIEIYGFTDRAFTDDIANYKDLTHFREPINTLMLEAVSRGEGRLVPETVDAYTRALEDKAWNYDTVGIKAYVEERLGQRQRVLDALENTE